MFAMNVLLVLIIAVTFAEAYDAREQALSVYSLGHANNYFAVNLHRELSTDAKGNVFFSPFAVSSALAMVYRGSRNETAKELNSVLGYETLKDSSVFSAFQYYLTNVIGRINPKIYTIYSIYAMVVDNSLPVYPEYKREMQEVFQAYVQEANLAEESAVVVDKMNTWAKIKTKGAIDNLVKRIDPKTKLFLASAAYFKGAWKVKFDPEDTKHHRFYNRGKRSNASEVLMMHSFASVRYFEDDNYNFTAVELLYEGRHMSMVIFLPNKVDGLRDLEKGLTATDMTFVRRQMYHMKVHITMPKLKLQMDRSLSRPLRQLGLTKIFKLGADLSGMVPEGTLLALDDIEHKATIEVNEEGSIAAAVTRIIMTKSMPMSIPDPEFKVDHPFLFAIFDTMCGMILFMGRVNELRE